MESKLNKIYCAFRTDGGRLTKQRKELILTIISNPECTPKEILYMSKKNNKVISQATVYRTINSLTQMGFIPFK